MEKRGYIDPEWTPNLEKEKDLEKIDEGHISRRMIKEAASKLSGKLRAERKEEKEDA